MGQGPAWSGKKKDETGDKRDIQEVKTRDNVLETYIHIRDMDRGEQAYGTGVVREREIGKYRPKRQPTRQKTITIKYMIQKFKLAGKERDIQGCWGERQRGQTADRLAQ